MTGRLRPPGRRLLLVIEDDPDTGSLLRMYFTGLNYDVEVATRGEDGLALAQRHYPDLALLDGFWISRLVETGKLQALDDLWSKESRAQWLPASVVAVTPSALTSMARQAGPQSLREAAASASYCDL